MSSTKDKKKHKRKRNINDVASKESELETMRVHDETSEPKKHKKRKHKTCNEVADMCEENQGTKRKNHDSEEFSRSSVEPVSGMSPMLDKGSVRPKKHKKKKHKITDTCERSIAGEDEKLELELYNQRSEQTISEGKPCISDGETGKRKKHKNRKRKTPDTEICDAPTAVNGKKREEKVLYTNSETDIMSNKIKNQYNESSETERGVKNKKSKQEKEHSDESNVNEPSTEKSKHGKKRKKHSIDSNELFMENSVSSESEAKVKKLKKAKKASAGSDVEVNLKIPVAHKLEEVPNEPIYTMKKKKKSRKSKDSVDDSLNMSAVENTSTPKEKKKSKEKNGSDTLYKTSDTFLPVESPKRDNNAETANDSSITTVVQGQWQGNMFESADRQAKFLRLLGGMKKSTPSGDGDTSAKKGLFCSQNSTKKKGLFGSLTSKTNFNNKSSTGNAALTITDSTTLDQKLEEDYNRAMSFRLGGKKGAGFGFSPDPAEGKKFHIDINKSNSIKFDD